MVESVGAYISESSERSARDVENMSKKIIRSNEKSFDEVTSLIEDYSTIAEEENRGYAPVHERCHGECG